jgi:hypothetical protein
MHVNKVSRVRTIDRVAKELGEDVNFLFDVAIEMEPEAGRVELIKIPTGKRRRASSADLSRTRQPCGRRRRLL